jgi:hypothetical protein
LSRGKVQHLSPVFIIQHRPFRPDGDKVQPWRFEGHEVVCRDLPERSRLFVCLDLYALFADARNAVDAYSSRCRRHGQGRSGCGREFDVGDRLDEGVGMRGRRDVGRFAQREGGLEVRCGGVAERSGRGADEDGVAEQHREVFVSPL